MNTELPYFDLLLGRLSTSTELAEVFGDHVHWGFFADDFRGVADKPAFLNAVRALSLAVIDRAGIRNNDRVLDVGCGFGGTAALVADSIPGVHVTAINIDPRQLEIARARNARPNIVFGRADACQLPFDSASFDSIIAVESIFHFPSRLAFLREARRVLKPDGQIALSDFVLHGPKLPRTLLRIVRDGNPMERFYGRVNTTTMTGYRILGFISGLRITSMEDVTSRTLPTYEFLKALATSINEAGMLPDVANRFMEKMTKAGELRYALVALRPR